MLSITVESYVSQVNSGNNEATLLFQYHSYYSPEFISKLGWYSLVSEVGSAANTKHLPIPSQTKSWYVHEQPLELSCYLSVLRIGQEIQGFPYLDQFLLLFWSPFPLDSASLVLDRGFTDNVFFSVFYYKT